MIHNVQGCPRFARIAGCATYTCTCLLWHASQSPVQSPLVKVSVRCEIGRLYMWRSCWEGMVDHDEDNEKGQQNQSIASLLGITLRSC